MTKKVYVPLLISLLILSFTPFVYSQQVGSDGSFHYSVPIEILPGTNGMQPKLSIEYNSNLANGMMGVGWMLSGIPSITRMHYGRGVNYDGQDTYASADGRLVQITPQHYQTENGTQDKYIPRGTCGDGPCYWQVKAKTGKTLYFGNSEDSRIEAIGRNNSVRVWALNRVEDRYGNFYTVEYNDDTNTGAFYPTKITYTQGNGLRIFRTVEFQYEDREDHFPKYTQSAKVDQNKRLQKIQILSNNQLLFEYKLTYKSDTLKSHLETIQQCDPQNTCKPPHHFTYSEATIGFEDFVLWKNFIETGGNNQSGNGRNGNYPSASNSNGVYEGFLDMNGDGLLDRVIHYNNQTKQYGIWVALNTKNGFGDFVLWNDFRNIGGGDIGNHLSAKDRNGNGIYQDFLDMNADSLLDRIINYDYQNKQDGLWVALNNQNQNFEAFRLWKDFRNVGGQTGYGNYPFPSNSYGTYETFLDMNGDGFLDRVIHYNYQTSQSGVYIALSNRNGDFEPFRLWKNFISMGGHPNGYGNRPAPSDSNGTYENFLDMNNDGLPDRVIYRNQQTSQFGIHVALNKGDDFENFVFWKDFGEPGGEIPHRNYPSTANSYGTYQTFLDMNGDGILDRVIHRNHQTNKDGIHVALGTGKDFKDFVFWKDFKNTGGEKTYGNYPSASNSNGTYESFLDMNNDGLPDRVIHKNVQTNQEGIHVALNKSSLPRLIGVKTPAGSTLRLEHALSSNLENVISMNATSCGGGTEVGYGKVCGIPNTSAYYLVTALHTENGRGKTFTKRYRYYNGRVYPGTIQVRKDLGFEWMKETDEQTGITIQTFFRQDRPFHSQVDRVERKDANENLLQQEIHTLVKVEPTTNPEVRLILGQQKQVSLFERGNLKSSYQVDSTHDAFGFLKQSTTTTGNDVTVQTYEYTHDLANWVLGQIDETKITENGIITKWERWVYQNFDVLRVQKYLCRVALTCSETNGNWVTTFSMPQYDAFGNLLSSRDALNQRTRKEYDLVFHGFVIKEINPKGQETNYELDQWGRIDKVIGSNGESQQIFYDVFGKKRKTIFSNKKVEEEKIFFEGDPKNQYLEKKVFDGNTTSWQRHYYDGLNFIYQKDRLGGEKIVRQVFEEVFQDPSVHNVVKIERTSEPFFEEDKTQNRTWKTTQLDDQGRRLLIIFPTGKRVSYQYGTNQTQIIQAEGTEILEFNIKNQLIRKQDVLGNDLLYEYGLENRLTKTIAPSTDSNNGQNLQITTIIYDSWGRKTSLTTPELGRTSYIYDYLGQLKTETDAQNRTIQYTHDSLGRVTSKQESTGKHVIYRYDNPRYLNSNGRLSEVEVQENNQTTLMRRFAYTPIGNIKAVQHTISGFSSFIERFEYDALGRVKLKVLPDGTNLRYQYTPLGNLQEVLVNGIQVAHYEDYNAKGLVGKRTIDSSRLPTSTWDQENEEYEVMTSFTYKDTGLLDTLQTQDETGFSFQDISYHFDVSGNLEEIREHRQNTQIDGINTSQAQEFVYDDLHRLERAEGLYGVKNYTYDALGNIEQWGGRRNRTFQTNANNQIITGDAFLASYSATGAMERKVIDAAVWDYTYTAGDILKSVSKDGHTTLDFQYDGNNRRFQKTYHALDGRTLTTRYITPDYEVRTSNLYPNLYKITRHIHAGKMGKLLTITTLEDQLMDPAQGILPGFYIDHILNLYDLWHPVGLVNAAWELSWFVVQGFNVQWFLVLWLLLILGLFSYVIFQIFKDLRNQGVSNSVFAPWQRLVSVCVVSIFFLSSCELPDDSLDPARSAEIVPPLHESGELPYYGNLDEVSKLAGSLIVGPLPGSWFYHQNYLGSTSIITDARGNIGSYLSYLPFGEIDKEHSTGSVLSHHTFTGQESDDESGLMYYQGRYYDPSIGRFITADIFLPESQNLQSYNRYAYVLNNPLKYVDPSGHFFKSIFKGIGKVFKAVAKIAKAVIKPIAKIVRSISKILKSSFFNIFSQFALNFILPGGGSVLSSASFVPGMSTISTGSFSNILKSGLMRTVNSYVPFSGTFNRISSILKNVTNVTNVMNPMKGMNTLSLQTKASSLFSNVKSKALQGFSRARSLVGERLLKTGVYAKQGFSVALSKFNNIAPKLGNAVRNMRNSIIDTLRSGISKFNNIAPHLGHEVRTIRNSIMDTVKKTFNRTTELYIGPKGFYWKGEAVKDTDNPNDKKNP